MAVTISHLTNIGRAAHWSMSCDSGSSESIFQHTITESWGQKNEKKENTAQVQSRRDIIQSNRTYLWVGQGKWDRVDGWRMMQSYPRGILRGGGKRERHRNTVSQGKNVFEINDWIYLHFIWIGQWKPLKWPPGAGSLICETPLWINYWWCASPRGQERQTKEAQLLIGRLGSTTSRAEWSYPLYWPVGTAVGGQ